MHLADAFIQSDFFLSVCVFPGNWTHNLCAANAILYHWATGTLNHQTINMNMMTNMVYFIIPWTWINLFLLAHWKHFVCPMCIGYMCSWHRNGLPITVLLRLPLCLPKNSLSPLFHLSFSVSPALPITRSRFVCLEMSSPSNDIRNQ